MPNLRILYNNIADTATIVASNTAAGFSVENLKNTQKTSVHRSTSSNLTYTLTWSTSQNFNCLALPATNLTSGSTIKLELYAEISDTSPIYQTVPLQACKDRQIVLLNSSSAPSYIDFGFGGDTKTSVWLSRAYSIKKLVITLVGSNTTFIDCARIVCGTYWESSRQVSNGITLGYEDTSSVISTRSGNTYVDRKPIVQNIQFNLSYIGDGDRLELQKLMRVWGSSGLMYVCVFPDNNNPEITQAYSIYGRSQSNSLQYQLYSLYNTDITINSW